MEQHETGDVEGDGPQLASGNSGIARTLDPEKRNGQLHSKNKWQNGVRPNLYHPKSSMRTAHAAKTPKYPSYLAIINMISSHLLLRHALLLALHRHCVHHAAYPLEMPQSMQH